MEPPKVRNPMSVNHDLIPDLTALSTLSEM